jgi:hypothetical protein
MQRLLRLGSRGIHNYPESEFTAQADKRKILFMNWLQLNPKKSQKKRKKMPFRQGPVARSLFSRFTWLPRWPLYMYRRICWISRVDATCILISAPLCLFHHTQERSMFKEPNQAQNQPSKATDTLCTTQQIQVLHLQRTPQTLQPNLNSNFSSSTLSKLYPTKNVPNSQISKRHLPLFLNWKN